MWVGWSFVHLEMIEQFASYATLWQHTFDCLLQNSLWDTCSNLLQGLSLPATWASNSVSVVDLLLLFPSSHINLVSIDDNDEGSHVH